MRRYFIGLIVIVGLIVLLIVLASGGHKTVTPSNVEPLPNYANTTATAQLAIKGPITAAQNHNEVQITVGNTDATMQVHYGFGQP